VTPAAQREAVRALRAQFAFSERRACRLVGMARATCQYRSRLDLATPLRERLRVLAEHRRRFGYRRLTVLLRREGLRVNHKRIYRLYREEGLAVRRRKRKRLSRIAVPPLPAVTRLNQRWTMDFIEDRLVTGRKFRTFNVVDAFSRKGLASEVDTSLPGARVVQVLDRLAETRGRPKELILDNGPEFIGRALDQWADSRGVRLRFIAPGKPVQNAHIESFHGRFRDECLNESWFLTLADARRIIEAWRQDYNTVRPHSALGYLTPDEFERMSRNGAELTPEDECMGSRLVPRKESGMLDATNPAG
jgi:putative transposase